MKRRSILAIIPALTLVVVGALSPAVAYQGASWIPISPQQDDPNYHSVTFQDQLPLKFNFSVLQGSDSSGNMWICKSTQDPTCANMPLVYNSVLKVCKNAADTDCIVSVSSVDQAGTPTQAKFSRYTVADHVNSYPADPKMNIPAGDTPSVWNIPGAPHSSGTDYVAFAGLSGWVDSNGKPQQGNPGQFGTYLEVSLVPVVLKDFGKGPNSMDAGWGNIPTGLYYDTCSEFQQTPTRKNINCGHVNGGTCLFPTNDQGMCYVAEDFPPTQRFNVQLRLSKEPTGWLHGRMVDPNVSISSNTTGPVELSVTAGSTSVPMVYQGGDWPTLPMNLKKFWVDCMTNGDICGGALGGAGAKSNYWETASTLAGNEFVNLIGQPYSFGPIALEGMAAIAPLIGDKSNAMKSSWSFRTLAANEMNGANDCFTKSAGLKGIVSTNSITYSAGPPAFKNNSLNYQVASPHFNSDGVTPFKGSYNLVMRSDVARCLYGFSSAPINASISIVSSEGSSDVATTVANEKDGWLYLSANNFQFSSPTIQVKLSQDAPAVVTPATPSKSTITCVKGKTTKTVTGVKPTCPAGYKRK
jgi:hypothetical protein